MSGLLVVKTDGHLTVTLPIRTVSEANTRGHWAKKASRVKAQREVTTLVLRSTIGRAPPAPLAITLIRIAPRRIDDDNNVRSMKAIRDSIAKWIGIDDGSKLLTWLYDQEAGAPKTYAVRVELAPR